MAFAMMLLFRSPRLGARVRLRTRGLGRIFSSKNSSEMRGLRLLRSWLSREQRAQFDADGHPVAGWCFVPTGHLVAGDVMLAQKIALETSEFGALAVANTFLPQKNTV
jgi:hypothetical protein